MVKIMRFIIIALFFSLSILKAQNISVSATTDSSVYKVGDFIKYEIEIRYDKGIVVYLPSVKDSIKTLDYIQTMPSEKNEVNNKITERFHFIFSKYDSSQVTIPSIAIAYTDGKSSVKKYIKTNPVTVIVKTLPVNQQEDIRDVKEPVKLPPNWLLIGIIILAIFILSVAGYFFYRYCKKKRDLRELNIPEIIIPSHEIALARLAELEKKKLWQNGLVKEYHSEVTDIVRQYFEARFNFSALEMTSSEILAVLSYLEEGKVIEEISQKFFSNADLVKFAKFEPIPTVNEEMMKQAYEIVNITIPLAVPVLIEEEQDVK